MPFYEYRCRKCHQSFSALRAMSDRDAPIACPECGAREVERLVSSFATSGGSTNTPGPCGSGFS